MKHSLNKLTLIKVFKTALHQLGSGESEQAGATLELAKQLRLSRENMRMLDGVIEQVYHGTVDKAEIWLGELMHGIEPKWRDINLRTAHLPKKALFKFRPNKHDHGDALAPTNGQRADIGKAMLFHVNEREPSRGERSEVLTDGLADLLHWCDREGVSFDEALRTARMHHSEER